MANDKARDITKTEFGSWGYSLRCRLISEAANAAAQHTIANGGDALDFTSAAESGVDVINSLTVGLIDARYGEHFNPKFWNFWRHEHAPLQLLGGKKKSPYFNRDFLVDAGSQYLALPYRAPLLERTLIDALMAAEVFAFGQLVREREPFLMRHVLAPYNRINPPSAVLGYFIGNILIAIFLGVPAAIIAWVAGVIFPGQAAFWVIVAAIGLWALLFAFSTILLPFQIWSGWTRRRNSRAMLEAAVKAYAELAPGVVSTIRVREVAAAAADKGVVWPNPAFALLDDNIKRSSGRL